MICVKIKIRQDKDLDNYLPQIIPILLIKITSFSLILLARFVALCISISLPTGGMIRQLPGSLFLGLMIPTIIHWKTMSVTMSMKIREQRKTI